MLSISRDHQCKDNAIFFFQLQENRKIVSTMFMETIPHVRQCFEKMAARKHAGTCGKANESFLEILMVPCWYIIHSYDCPGDLYARMFRVCRAATLYNRVLCLHVVHVGVFSAVSRARRAAVWASTVHAGRVDCRLNLASQMRALRRTLCTLQRSSGMTILVS